jgi:hypothetical protein
LEDIDLRMQSLQLESCNFGDGVCEDVIRNYAWI